MGKREEKMPQHKFIGARMHWSLVWCLGVEQWHRVGTQHEAVVQSTAHTCLFWTPNIMVCWHLLILFLNLSRSFTSYLWCSMGRFVPRKSIHDNGSDGYGKHDEARGILLHTIIYFGWIRPERLGTYLHGSIRCRHLLRIGVFLNSMDPADIFAFCLALLVAIRRGVYLDYGWCGFRLVCRMNDFS